MEQLANAKTEVLKPFAFEDELKEKTDRLNALNIELNLDEKDTSDGYRARADQGTARKENTGQGALNPVCTFVLLKSGQYNRCRLENVGGDNGV